MLKIEGTTIQLTRSNTARITVGIYDSDGNEYTVQDGDTVHFSVKKNAEDDEAVIDKDIDTTTMILEIDPDDTAELGMGDVYGRYEYDIDLIQNDGTKDTFISGVLYILKEV